MVLFSRMASATPELIELIEFCLLTKKNWCSDMEEPSSLYIISCQEHRSVVWKCSRQMTHLEWWCHQTSGWCLSRSQVKIQQPMPSVHLALTTVQMTMSSVFRTAVLFPDTTYIFILLVKWHKHITTPNKKIKNKVEEPTLHSHWDRLSEDRPPCSAETHVHLPVCHTWSAWL